MPSLWSTVLPALLAFCSAGALGQSYPTRAIKLVVPSSPGGGTDIVARILGQKLSEQLGQQFVVENRAGAGTVIGNDAVAKSAPDGYTLLMGLSTLAINPSMYAKLPYDALRDFAPISQSVSACNILILHPSVPAKTVTELIALARAKPGILTFGSAGMGTNPHLSGELFKSLARIDMVHVPFKGSGQSIISQLAGEIAANFPSVPTAMPYIKAGRLRGIGVTTLKRVEVLPDVPSIAEAGLPGYEATQWFGLLAPAGTPRPIIDRLYQESSRALRSADMKERMTAEGLEVVGGTPEEFASYIRSETEKWTQVIKAAGIKPQ
ncbi:MAG TPA: tripartite tricarboxylate transporter substrate binding protein [Burkholderiales bacterium]|nr:tripartite tricarboxylate transporter substrate binding protein [Burkholderiales bacterium]